MAGPITLLLSRLLLVQEDIDEAHRLMRSSKKSLFEACENQQTQIDPLSAIYSSLRDDSQARGKRTYVWAELLAMFQRRFTVRCPPRSLVTPCKPLSWLPHTAAPLGAQPNFSSAGMQ